MTKIDEATAFLAPARFSGLRLRHGGVNRVLPVRPWRTVLRHPSNSAARPRGARPALSWCPNGARLLRLLNADGSVSGVASRWTWAKRCSSAIGDVAGGKARGTLPFPKAPFHC